jgi:diguanylate cyclase (GGDEF)-like protein/PAS domain S-box-containing protein
VILGSVLLALFGGLTFGVIFARRLVRPLTVLAGHAEAIRASSEVTEISDASITQAPDEFGVLARSFNRMIAEIIVARQRLVDWSEAQLTIQYERLDAALNNMSQGLIMIDKEKRLVLCNDRYINMYGLSRDIVKPGCSLEALIRHRAELGHRLRSADQAKETSSQLEAGKPASFLLETRDGREISVVQQPMLNGGWVSTHEDITERRAAEAKISHMALHDALTNLPNRVFFHEKVRELFTRGERYQEFAVMCFDLDRFKNVNDTLGHKFGDILLGQVAERVRACLREGDTLARLGGDEFAILLADCSQAAEVNSLAARLNKVIGSPFDLEGHQAVIGVSIGIAVAPTDAANPEQLLKNADLALYRAKTDGRGTYRFFQPEMDALMQKRRALEFDLRRALSKGEFELFYQPIVNLTSGDVAGFEALLRWNHPERGLVSPLDFIGLAEETELIIPIGDWVLREACREAVKWPSNVRIAVNVSPIQFKSELALAVTGALAQSGLHAQRLELEITESVLLYNAESTLAMLHQLRALGVSISMDDFGTGYSSLSYLRSFPFDKIKIDRSFVHNVAQNEDSMAIVRAVTGLGSSLGMATTGEGVETMEESSYLKSQGCTEAQGFLFSKPGPANEVPEMLLKRSTIPRAVA